MVRNIKKVKVKLLVNTAYQGPRKEGDVFSVPEDFAKRWVKNAIAVYVEDENKEAEVNIEEEVVEQTEQVEELEEVEAEELEEVETTEAEEVIDYSAMSAKDLYTLCKDKGLDVEAKKGKEYYIEKLNA